MLPRFAGKEAEDAYIFIREFEEVRDDTNSATERGCDQATIYSLFSEGPSQEVALQLNDILNFHLGGFRNSLSEEVFPNL